MFKLHISLPNNSVDYWQIPRFFTRHQRHLPHNPTFEGIGFHHLLKPAETIRVKILHLKFFPPQWLVNASGIVLFGRFQPGGGLQGDAKAMDGSMMSSKPTTSLEFQESLDKTGIIANTPHCCLDSLFPLIKKENPRFTREGMCTCFRHHDLRDNL